MEAELKPSNSIGKSENGNIHLGRILLCGSIIKSKLLATSEIDDQIKIVTILLESGSKRSYLSFYSTSFIIELLNDFDAKSLKSTIWPILKKELSKKWTEQTLDTLYLILIINEKFPSLVGPKFLKEHLGSENIIDVETLENLLKLVTDIPRIHYCHHPLYKILCKKLISSNILGEFWSGIDKKFDKPSRTMEVLSLELLNMIVPQLTDKSILPSLLSPNFIQYMLKRFTSSKKNRKDSVANSFRAFFNHIVTALNDKDISTKIPISVIKKLILHPGDLMIEKTTGTKILQMITSNLTTKTVKKLSKIYHEIASNSVKRVINDRELSWLNAERLYAAQLLSKLLGHSAVNSEHAWRLDQLKYLFDSGFCESSNIGVELASQFRDMFYRALDHKLPKLDDLRSVLSDLVDYLDQEIFQKKTKTLRNPLDEIAIEAWNKMTTFIKRPETDFKSKNAVLIFFTMELSMGLHLFLDTEMAISSINEIQSCSERLLSKKINKKNKKDKTNEAENEPEWVEVIVDLLLSLLSRNNHLLRSLGKCVFPHLCPELTSTSIHQILAVLDPKDERGPLGPKNSEEDDDKSNDESGSESDDADSGEDNDDKNEEKESEEDMELDESSDDGMDDDDDDNEDEDEDETVTDRLRLALHQALGDASAQTDDEDVDIDAIDDEEGKRLDASLAAAFKILRESRRNQKKKQKKSAEALTHFRVRVIDLLEIYLDCSPSMALALDMLVPMFALLEFSIKDQHQKPLENRVRSCLKKLSSVKKFKDHDNVDEKLIKDMAKLLIQKGERSTSICQEMGDKLAECCTFLIRCTQQAGLPASTLVDIYAENLTAFFKKRDCILSAVLFKSALQLSWDGIWQFVPLIVDYAFDPSIRSFRRGQALEFLTVFYRNNRVINNEEHKNLRQKLEKKLCENSISWFKETNESQVGQSDDKSQQNGTIGKEVRQKFVCLLWTLLKAIYQHHIPKAWNWNAIADAMVEYRKINSLSKDAKSAYNRLAQNIGAPINIKTTIKQEKIENGGDATKVVNGELKNEDEVDDENEDSKDEKKNKKKKKHDYKKQKKEARELRAKAMAKGLEDLNFSSLGLLNGSEDPEIVPTQNGDIKEEEEEEEQENNETKPKKRKSAVAQEDTPGKIKKKKKQSNN